MAVSRMLPPSRPDAATPPNKRGQFMRIRRLDLLRYGRFTGASLDLPKAADGAPDIHIVFGPNEAGKSTAMSAIEEMLFGVANMSPYNFLHEYPSMRVGAVIETADQMLEFRRRKGKKDTILGPDEAPLGQGEAALAPFLAGADQQFFTRMFSLDYERLRQGGKEILDAQDEAGQTLFSAGAGLAGLRERLNELDEEADALWGPRRAARRKYSQAEDRLKAAEAALRDHTVTAAKWHELRRAFETASEAFAAIEREIESRSAELRRLSRIRRVYRNVHGKIALEARIAELGGEAGAGSGAGALLLPPNAAARLEAAEREDASASIRIEALAEQLAAGRTALLAITCDETLLRRAEDVARLHELRIRARAAGDEAPKLKAELERGEAGLRRLASELDWGEAGDGADSIDALTARIPPRARVASLRTLLTRRGELLATVASAEAAFEESEARSAELQRQFEELDVLADSSMLAAVIADCRNLGDIGSRIDAAQAEAEDARASAERRLRTLRPELANLDDLAAPGVPPRDAAQFSRDAQRELRNRISVCGERMAAARQELSRRQKAYERIVREGKAVLPEDMARVRQHRDEGWSLVRRRYVEGEEIPSAELCRYAGDGGSGGGENDLAQAFETAMREADDAADRRFDGVEASAKLSEASRRVAEQEEAIAALAGEQERLAREEEAWELEWRSLWAGAIVAPLSPDLMLDWMSGRTEALTLMERGREAGRRAAGLRAEEVQAKQRLLAELSAVAQGPDAGVLLERLEGQSLRVAVERAADMERACRKAAGDRRQLEDSLARAAADARTKGKALEKSRRAWAEWEGKWAAALEASGLSGAAGIEAVAAQVDAIDEMREIATAIGELRHRRLAGIEQEVAAFEEEAAGLLGAVAPDLGWIEVNAAVIELEGRLAETERARAQMMEKIEAVQALEVKIENCERARREARLAVRELQDAARVESLEALKAAISRSDQMRELRAALSRADEALAQDGDGLPLSELAEACRDADLDQVAAREEALETELKDLRARLMEAQQRRLQARREFEAIGGADAAARAASDRQAALTELTETASAYARARAAGLLLRWAIDRYRREKQAPLLKRAGECFAGLTNGSFAGLQLEFDDRDNARITGVRPDGARVGVTGMSAGTADQLFLALRLAAVEDYLSRARALPFVADDLFINFDDERSGAGFEALARLALRTQVLFFTHHSRHVEIARARLGEVQIVELRS